ncbi:hypothetical protein AWB64_01257 [Caballeronia sordidicola]|uniref:Uncharacterized protein n=1 Tax=Caballeronia sordidicola TaxID=196367 RepID=A0A158FHJ2_CABSO|nr:hypothetical protein [Caballeronia sordidicola]SAL18510.1 hypothetical protein AWB64_01257 [Caballeronia sordidicola]
MAQEYDAEIGRTLGWDLASYGWTPRNDAPAHVLEGHAEGKARFGPNTKVPTRFERKWLQLRQNALRRGKIVDAAITPRFIEFIDYPTCPVTLVEMTHSTGADTDWSVDRVNNDGAYADGNLIVMSVRANKAKGSKSLLDVKELLANWEPLPGLSFRESFRLLSLMEKPCSSPTAQEPRNTLFTRLCFGTARTNYQNLQHILVMCTTVDSSKRNAMFRTLSDAHTHADSRASASLLKLAYEKLVKRMQSVDYMYDACSDEAFQTLLRRWVETIPSTRRKAFDAKLEAITGGSGIPKEVLRTWALESKGRFADW